MALRPEHVKYLNDRGITDPDVIEARGYESVETGLRIPVYDIADGKEVNYEIRLDKETKPGRKFDRPSGVGNRLNINPMMLWKVKSAKHLLFIVEGTTRADALAQQGIAAISLTGIYGWISNKKDGTLADWKDLGLKDRPVVIVPDGDVLNNKDVNRATHELLDFMDRKGANARVAIIPDGLGLDDWLARGNAHADIHSLTVDKAGLPKLVPEKTTPEKVAQDRKLPDLDDRSLAEMWVRNDPTHAVRVAGTDQWWFYDDRGVWMKDGSKAAWDVKISLSRFLSGLARKWEQVRDDPNATPDVRRAAREVIHDLRASYKTRSVYDAFGSLGMGISSIREEDFDRDQYLFNVANGTVDLRTGKIKKHDASDYLRGASPTSYNPQASTARWEAFLAEVFPNDPELIKWLQLVLGSSLIARTTLHILPVFVGKGRNGKGTLVRALSNALGRDFMTTIDKSLLITNKYESHPTKLMALKGKRLVTASETEDGDKFAAASIKALTGGDEITARGMREDQQTFMPSHNMILMTNSLPEVDVSDEAMWARLKLIKFPVSFADAPDLGIDGKLAKEAEGILKWLIEGAVRFYVSGERLPADPMSVLSATGDWRMQGNSLLEFLSQKVRRAPGSSIPAGEFMEAYRKWAEQAGLPVLHTTAFGRIMDDAGYIKHRKTNGISWLDVRWTTPNEENVGQHVGAMQELGETPTSTNQQVEATFLAHDVEDVEDTTHSIHNTSTPITAVSHDSIYIERNGDFGNSFIPVHSPSSGAITAPTSFGPSSTAPTSGNEKVTTPWGELDSDLLDEYGRVKADLTTEQVGRLNQQFKMQE